MNGLRSFYEGLTAVRGTYLAASLALALLLTGATETALRRFAFFPLPEGKFLIWTHDIWSALPHRIGLLAASPQEKRLILVGSSSLYHSFYGARGLESTVRDRGYSVPVSLFHTPRQSLGDVLQIVENLPPGNGTLVVATTSGRTQANAPAMAAELATSHLLLRSPALAEFLEARGVSGWRARFLLPAALNYLRLYLSLNRRHVIEGRLPNWRLFTDRDQERWQRLLAASPTPPPAPVPEPPLGRGSLLHQHQTRRAEHVDQLELLNVIVRAARQKGYDPVLLETPLNPLSRREYPERAAWIRATHTAFADLEGIPYLDFFSRLNVPSDDFLDTVHLKEGSPGRLRFHHALAEALLRLRAPTGNLASRGGAR